MKAIIIEDEYHSALALQQMLDEYCKSVTCIGMYDSVASGIDAITTLKPDLVFLDVMIKNQTGFDLLELLPGPHPQVIFTTAYEEFAIRAIRFSASDYLLKPLSIKELQAAVLCAGQNLQRYGIEKLNMLSGGISNGHQLQRLALPTLEGHVFVDIDDIIRLEANGSYTIVIFRKESPITVSRQLKEYEQILQESGFVRAHNSHIVNILHVKKYVRGGGGYLVMSDGKNIDVSQSKKNNLLKVLSIP